MPFGKHSTEDLPYTAPQERVRGSSQVAFSVPSHKGSNSKDVSHSKGHSSKSGTDKNQGRHSSTTDKPEHHVCCRCGTKDHLVKNCTRTSSKYFNSKAKGYGDSEAYQKLLKVLPCDEKSQETSIPSATMLVKIGQLSDKVFNPKDVESELQRCLPCTTHCDI